VGKPPPAWPLRPRGRRGSFKGGSGSNCEGMGSNFEGSAHGDGDGNGDGSRGQLASFWASSDHGSRVAGRASQCRSGFAVEKYKLKYPQAGFNTRTGNGGVTKIFSEMAERCCVLSMGWELWVGDHGGGGGGTLAYLNVGGGGGY
jgi:hypothetical protein